VFDEMTDRRLAGQKNSRGKRSGTHQVAST
jgi:hypothetical protein